MKCGLLPPMNTRDSIGMYSNKSDANIPIVTYGWIRDNNEAGLYLSSLLSGLNIPAIYFATYEYS